jgi:hypothetical protein
MTDDIIEELRESYKKYGPIRKVVRTQFGVASGNTRLKAVPEWPVLSKEVKSYYEHLQISAADNISEPKSPEWWTKVLSEAGKELEKQGVEPGRIVARLKEDFPISERSIYRYLPSEFKDSVKVEAGRLGGEAAATVAAESSGASAPVTGKPEPYRKGFSPSLKENNPAQLTPSHLKLFGLIRSIPGTNFLNEKPHLRENPPDADEYTNELTKDGHEKSYQTDLTDFGLKLVVEAMGPGSSSDDPARDAYFEKEGYSVLKFTNEEIDHAPRLVRLASELKVENLGLRAQLAASGGRGS